MLGRGPLRDPVLRLAEPYPVTDPDGSAPGESCGYIGRFTSPLTELRTGQPRCPLERGRASRERMEPLPDPRWRKVMLAAAVGGSSGRRRG